MTGTVIKIVDNRTLTYVYELSVEKGNKSLPCCERLVKFAEKIVVVLTYHYSMI